MDRKDVIRAAAAGVLVLGIITALVFVVKLSKDISLLKNNGSNGSETSARTESTGAGEGQQESRSRGTNESETDSKAGSAETSQSTGNAETAGQSQSQVESEGGTTGGNTEPAQPTFAPTPGVVPPNGYPVADVSAYATEYEGTKGTGKYNYGEALQKSLLFYELQRSGDLSACEGLRTNWRGNSGMTDGSPDGIDLTGGLYDAGDNVKFNLPMAYTSSVLAWSLYEYPDAYEESGQKEYLVGTLKWVNDYLMKCHPQDDVFYYQVGDGGTDHGWWGPAEVMHMNRPVYKVTVDSPGSCVAGEAAASLAAAATVLAGEDPDYSKKCLKHAEQLYDFAERTQSDAGYTAANGFYNSWSGFNDELVWAGCWLYLATGEKEYLEKAEKYMAGIDYDPKWTMCWDDVSTGALVMLCELTGDSKYSQKLEQNLDWWTDGMSDGSRITYSPKGLAWLDSWGSLRYASTESFVAFVYSKCDICPEKKADKYTKFAESQINYALGDGGRSYVVGFGENYPKNIHHRTAHGSYTNNINDPADTRHILFGALCGGPDANDGYDDTRSNYTNGEVADDYNAGFTGALAAMYQKYKGQTLKAFGAVENTDGREIFAEAGINVDGREFVEIKAYVYNESAWPARTVSDLELRYFVDLSEIYNAGGSAADITVSGNYSQGGSVAPTLTAYDEERHIYYASVDFGGTDIYPGGQESYRKEVQFRMRNGGANGLWENENDFSFDGLAGTTGSTKMTEKIALYENGVLVWGQEP